MNIPLKQLTHPGIFDASDEREKQFLRFKKAVERAKFLSKDEKRNWIILGYQLNTKQLTSVERLIITKDLQLLDTKHKLEKIKPNKK